MASVWRVVDEVTGDELALKHADGGRGKARDGDRIDVRFRREFHTLASLRHPRIVRVLDFGIDPAGPYYTMDLLGGRDLKDAGRLSWRAAVVVLRDVAAALATLHARGLVHRDIAPRNVRLLDDGHAVLFDFGLLASVGSSGDVAGTATAVAPETVRGQPVDGRADLFGLGSLAYWLLTGEHAFPARTFGELESLWHTPPPPVSVTLANETTSDPLPHALDVLVASLLAIDPLARPGSAAEVIDRLAQLLDLPGDDVEVARGFLASTAMVGREREVALLRGCIAEVAAGTGHCVVIEADSGTGKSRLLREVALHSQLAGLRVVEASGDFGRTPWGVMQHLVERALALVPASTLALDETDALALVRLFPAVADALAAATSGLRSLQGRARNDATITEPAEQRLRTQSGLVRLWRALGQTTGFAILVDDLQRCDEASAAVLAALARGNHEIPLLVAATLRTGETPRAEVAVDAIAATDLRLRLLGLGKGDIETLVTTTFGAVPHTVRLASWLHAHSGGSPMLCAELLRQLCTDGTVRLVDGAWMLPAEYDAIDLPRGLAAAMDHRIGCLAPSSRALAEILVIAGVPLALRELLALAAPDLAEPEVFAALDELIQQQIVVGDGDRHSPHHDGFREAIRRQLSDDRACVLHGRIGRWLQDVPGTSDARIGWHLLAAGDRRRGAELLARVGQRSFRDQALVDCIAPLEAALTELVSDPRCARQCLEMQFMLVSAGWISDRKAGLRHMHGAIDSLRRHGGVALAERLGPWCGRHVALVLGIVCTMIAWVCSRPSRRGPSPIAALATFAVTIGYACGLEYANHNRAGLQRLIDSTKPLAAFRGRLLFATHLGLTAFPDLMLGRLGDARSKLERVLEIIANDRITPIGDFERRYAEAGILSLIAQIQITNLDAELPRTLARMRAHQLRYYDLVAGVTEAAALRFRGLETSARAIERALEPVALQLGSWSTDVQRVLFGHPPYGAAGDVANLKIMVDELERLVAQGFGFTARLEMTRGDLCRARGEPTAALHHYAAALAALDDDELLTRVWIGAGMAEAHLALDQPDAALGHAERVLAIASAPASAQLSVQLRALTVIALAHAGLGRIEQAERAASRATSAAQQAGSPMELGMAHAARAKIARIADDSAAFHLHAELAAKQLRACGSGPLAALAERVLDTGSNASTSGRRRVAAEVSDSVTSLSQLVTSANDGGDR